ncbi:hypothetical protein FOXG_00448 [Fusarium oxysporum f. sp. lycopersici 4287]|uniref:Zinc finger PHD-type domain-containing protein n=1 Tax=Fusarium oxysporum f. sp. lycopersici (strain 4287 / CBS 123668 / FGSC 9935 / NRRL 34936) TaxID=426428 RepID=A0A0J9WG42_FUSO4|nr:hypothetical protein FOXG_00448 [Fusarium oxysporum f. sp. lycopersici 4287]XP_018232423.1 hypothetical protein FOXG_00448 [Fusarium oxysporum f. sp. lycopersici 4287]KNA94376.1 hypothetical protein FOXG_00448 [Fusarium oxysporum f. sp. lycopersici 4287]KNA94377.1 hypothetical protein FOXG_00448 [Fusarium oxysporum f. sp. lycopersici 4287]
MMDQDTQQLRVESPKTIELDVTMEDMSAKDVISITPAPKLSYTPQFPSESSVILSRLKNDSQTEGNENVREKHFADLKDTLTMPTPTKAKGQSSLPYSLNAGVKRKREEPSEKIDLTQSTVPFPWKIRSQIQEATIEAQHTREETRCSMCDGSAQVSPLVTCIRCLVSWHQKCHPPLMRGEDMTSASFTCADCIAGREQTVRLRGRVSQQRQHEIERLRQKRLSALPKGVVPAKPHLVGFGPGRASDVSRAQYFESMPKTDLLNILSLCDQLKPNLLVDVLVSISKRHPEMPIFDSPDWDSQLLNTSRPPKTKHDEKPRHGHVLVNRAAKPKQKTTKKILKRTRVIEVITSAPEEDNVDILPPTWAKAGQGLYSQLLPDTEDRSLLMDENDEESFSHFLVDGAGRQIMEPVGA